MSWPASAFFVAWAVSSKGQNAGGPKNCGRQTSSFAWQDLHQCLSKMQPFGAGRLENRSLGINARKPRGHEAAPERALTRSRVTNTLHHAPRPCSSVFLDGAKQCMKVMVAGPAGQGIVETYDKHCAYRLWKGVKCHHIDLDTHASETATWCSCSSVVRNPNNFNSSWKRSENESPKTLKNAFGAWLAST